MLLLLDSTNSAPVVLGFSPPTGSVGTIIEVVGTGFIGVTGAEIGEDVQDVAVISDSVCRVTVLAGTTTGKITLTNSAGTGTSAVDFVVIPPPLDISGVSDGQLLRRVSGAVAGLDIGAGLAAVSGALVVTLLGLFNTWTKNQRVTQVTLTSATSIAIDLRESQSFVLTAAHNPTITFTNLAGGMSWQIQVSQDATGSRVITWPAGINWGGSEPPQNLAPNAVQRWAFTCIDGSLIWGYG